MTKYKTFSDIVEALSDDSLTNKDNLIDLLRLYNKSMEESKELGYVGVGCISYAQEVIFKHQTENPNWE